MSIKKVIEFNELEETCRFRKMKWPFGDHFYGWDDPTPPAFNQTDEDGNPLSECDDEYQDFLGDWHEDRDRIVYLDYDKVVGKQIWITERRGWQSQHVAEVKLKDLNEDDLEADELEEVLEEMYFWEVDESKPRQFGKKTMTLRGTEADRVGYCIAVFE